MSICLHMAKAGFLMMWLIYGINYIKEIKILESDTSVFVSYNRLSNKFMIEFNKIFNCSIYVIALLEF